MTALPRTDLSQEQKSKQKYAVSEQRSLHTILDTTRPEILETVPTTELPLGTWQKFREYLEFLQEDGNSSWNGASPRKGTVISGTELPRGTWQQLLKHGSNTWNINFLLGTCSARARISNKGQNMTEPTNHGGKGVGRSVVACAIPLHGPCESPDNG